LDLNEKKYLVMYLLSPLPRSVKSYYFIERKIFLYNEEKI
jgi:hypothetical protein